MVKRIKQEILKHRFTYLLVAAILIAAFVLRVWRIGELLGFYFDQGRDALVIERLLRGHLVFIGPVTGLEGVFLGPFYYYFLAPGYLLGGGNPTAASIWQSFFVVLGLLVTFSIARFYISLRSAIVVLALMSLSYLEVKDNRWLANPVPTTLFGPLTVLFLILSFKKSKIFLPLAAICLGLLLQLEASSAFFLTIITTILILIYRKSFGWRSILFAAAGFLVTFIPQILFEVKNRFLLSRNLIGFLTEKSEDSHRAFEIPNIAGSNFRLELYSSIFFDKLLIDSQKYALPFFIIFLILTIYFCQKNWSNPAIKVVSFWFFGVLLLFMFYRGNSGQINSYYFTPLISLFFILLALSIEFLLKNRVLKPVIIAVVLGLIFFQMKPILNYLSSGVGKDTINLKSSSDAVKFILADSGGQPYNVDVYVPPVIPYSYTYLFDYYSTQANRSSDKMENVLYTIHEVDLEIPAREQKWLARQTGIAEILKEATFGGVKVEKRQRIKNE